MATGLEIDNNTGLIKYKGNIKNPLSFYTYSDSTDVNLNAKASALAIGSSQTVYIPTRGRIFIAGTRAVVDASAAAASIVANFALKIGTTVYDFTYQSSGSGDTVSTIANDAYLGSGADTVAAAAVGYASHTFSSNGNTWVYGSLLEDLIARDSFPTGEQTVSLVCYENTAVANGVIKGTTRATNITLGVEDWT